MCSAEISASSTASKTCSTSSRQAEADSTPVAEELHEGRAHFRGVEEPLLEHHFSAGRDEAAAVWRAAVFFPSGVVHRVHGDIRNQPEIFAALAGELQPLFV